MPHWGFWGAREVGERLSIGGREMDYSPGGFRRRCCADSLGGQSAFKLGLCSHLSYSISLGSFVFIFMGIVVVVGILVVIEGRQAGILSPGTGS